MSLMIPGEHLSLQCAITYDAVLNSPSHSERARDDVFDLRTEGGKLVTRASDPSSAAMGLNCYLRYYCHRSMSLVGNKLAPVKVLPELARPVHRTLRFKYPYFLNYCTFNYSFAFADWPVVERQLDWMVLNGINLALAVNGTEAVGE